jgi:hypothetical protein
MRAAEYVFLNALMTSLMAADAYTDTAHRIVLDFVLSSANIGEVRKKKSLPHGRSAIWPPALPSRACPSSPGQPKSLPPYPLCKKTSDLLVHSMMGVHQIPNTISAPEKAPSMIW